MSFSYENLKAGTNENNSDTGLEVARKVNDNFSKVQEALADIEASLNSYLKSVSINGTKQTSEDGNVDLPVGSTTPGLVKSADGVNNILISSDGTMEVASLNAEKLTQSDGDYLILDGNIP